MNYKEILDTLLQQGVEDVQSISDTTQRVQAYALLALAAAEAAKLENEPSGKESLKKETSKGKKAASKKKETVKAEETAPVEETAPAPEETAAAPEQPVDDNPWTEEKTKQYEDTLGLLQQYVDAWGADYVYGIALCEFMQEPQNSITEENCSMYIVPDNVEAFVAYLNEIANQQ